jgi:hypothetical protein
VQIAKNQMRGISDLHGVLAIRMDNTPEKRGALVERLRRAGCAVDSTGTDWYSEGDFDKAT